MSQSTPVVNSGLKYINGLQMSYTSTTSITVQPGRARDAVNVNDIVVGFPPSVAASQTGEATSPAYPTGVTTLVSSSLTVLVVSIQALSQQVLSMLCMQSVTASIITQEA